MKSRFSSPRSISFKAYVIPKLKLSQDKPYQIKVQVKFLYQQIGLHEMSFPNSQLITMKTRIKTKNRDFIPFFKLIKF